MTGCCQLEAVGRELSCTMHSGNIGTVALGHWKLAVI